MTHPFEPYDKDIALQHEQTSGGPQMLLSKHGFDHSVSHVDAEGPQTIFDPEFQVRFYQKNAHA
jgi:hypothetical protein